MFIFHMFSAIITGVCKLLLIVAIGCYLLSAVSADAENDTFSGRNNSKLLVNKQSTFASRSYEMASDVARDVWDEVSQYRIQIVRVE